MDLDTTSTSPERLLAESEWLVRLARSLVATADDAADLAQDTLVAALAHPPDGDRPLRPWLARIAKNLSITHGVSRARQAARERDVARAEHVFSTDEVVARVSMQRTVVEAVLSLAEPYRSTILLRYWDGLSAAKIAERSQAPEETVRTRVKRGLALLRERLDHRHGGRETWLSALIPIASGHGLVSSTGVTASALGAGVVAMSTQSKVILSALVVLVLSWGALRVFSPDTDEPGNAVSMTTSGAPLDDPAMNLPSTSGNGTRTTPTTDPITGVALADKKSVAAFFVRGKVVDDRRFPAADVEVRLVRANGETVTVRTDEEGAFEFAIPERPERSEGAFLWALRDQETAISSVSLPDGKPRSTPYLWNPPLSGDVNVGALTLRQARALHVSVTENSQPAVLANVLVRVGVDPTVLWRGTSDASGLVTTPLLPDGCVNIQAERGAADGRARVFLPHEDTARIVLAPRFEATITLVDKQTGAPVGGAMVQLTENIRAPSTPDASKGFGSGEYSTSWPVADGKQSTDAEGIARFSSLSSGGVYYLRAGAAGFVGYPPPVSSGEPIKAERPALRIELERGYTRTVHWPIEAGEVPAPEEGSRIVLSPAPGSFRDRFTDLPGPDHEGTVRDSQVVAERIEGSGYFLGTAPDGSIASFTVEENVDVGRPVSFRRPRTIDLSVRDSAGSPVADVAAHARNQGNNPLGMPVRTGADGCAKLTGLYGELAEVYVLPPDPGSRELSPETVNLRAGDAHLEFVIPAFERMRALLEVRINGLAGLPPEYQLTGAGVLEEKPATGELALSLQLPAKGEVVTVWLSSMGFMPAKVTLPVVRDGSEPRAVIHLTRSSTLIAKVVMPRTKDRAVLKIRSWNESKHQWAAVSHYPNGLSTPNGAGGSFCFYQLGPGRYMVLDENSKVESESVEIIEGQLEAEVVLDLGGLEWVSGRVEVPDGADLRQVRVVNTTAALSLNAAWLPGKNPDEGAYVSPDGTFRMRIKHGVAARLRAWHPWLAPADPGGEIELDSGRENVVLKLVAGHDVRISVPQLAATRSITAARIAVYDGPVKGEPRAWLHAPLIDGVLRFTGVPEGRATLWIDPCREFAPLVLENVEITAGVTDLGVANFSRGSSFRIKLAMKQGEIAPRIYIFARREVAPVLNRELNSDGSTEVVLSGLEAGRYKVSYSSIMGGGNRNEREIEFDGKTDVETTLDFR